MEKKKMNLFHRIFGIRKQSCCAIRIEEVDPGTKTEDKVKAEAPVLAQTEECDCGGCCDGK